MFWTLLVGIGAVAGAFMMFYDPSGKAMGLGQSQQSDYGHCADPGYLSLGQPLSTLSGGEIVFAGTPKDMAEHSHTITAEYLRKSM